jgi:FixJ family two-component response regulator
MTRPSIISVVDDDASVGRAISNFLQARGYVVHIFESAEEYLGSPHLNDTSCVIADVQMPAMDGFELLAKMRVHDDVVPFIFISGSSDESVRARALKAGAVGFLVKPFAATSLIACLDAALGPQCGGVDTWS